MSPGLLDLQNLTLSDGVNISGITQPSDETQDRGEQEEAERERRDHPGRPRVQDGVEAQAEGGEGITEGFRSIR